MAKHFAVIALIVSAFCFSSALARGTPADDLFHVEGKVYCDPCRLEFETRLSHPLSGMKVTLQCRNEDNASNVTYRVEGVTDKNGFYSLPVKGDHQDDICEVKTERSTHPKCKEPMMNRDSDRIVLTKNMGVSSSKRFVNPLGFMTRSIDARCLNVAKELGLDQLDF